MILTGSEIERQHKLGAIRISDFAPKQVSPNSYDLMLGPTLLRYTDDLLDVRLANKAEIINIPEDGYRMDAGAFLVGTCQEYVGSDQFVPIIHGKSGIARVGMFPHITADLLHLGFYGRPTLQLYAAIPLIIYAFVPIAQVSFWVPYGKIISYNGGNQGCDGPYVEIALKDLEQ
ncbi:dCTP deaminase [bacterium]|nr:dCTP deaminase [bacterium]